MQHTKSQLSRWLMLLFLVPLNVVQLTAQDQANRQNPYVDQFLIGRVNEPTLEKFEGSPYPVQTFEPATVYLKNGGTSDHQLRYNAFRDEMEFQKNGKTFEVINKKDIDHIQLGLTRYYCFPLSDREHQPKLGYGRRILGNDSLALYQQKLVGFRPAKRHMIAGQGYSPASYVKQQPRYFLRYPGQPTLLLSARKKLFYEQLEALAVGLSQIAKERRLGADEEGYRAITTLLLEAKE